MDHDLLFDLGFAATTLGIPSLDFLVNAKLFGCESNKLGGVVGGNERKKMEEGFHASPARKAA